MTRLLLAVAASCLAVPLAAQAPRQLTDALGSIYRSDQYTAFDWISGTYDRGTLTLEGYAARPSLKTRAEDLARRARGVDTVVNNIEVLPAHQSDDAVRVRAYVAIYGHPGLQRYSPGGAGISGFGEREIETAAHFGLDAAQQFRGPHPIHIVVAGGRIQLFGTVANEQDRRTAEVQVRGLPGVQNVVNRIAVRRR